VNAIDAYLAERLTAGGTQETAAPYRGLAPDSRLFLTRCGKPMRIVPCGPIGQHLICKEIHEIYRRILGYGELCGINTAFGRRIAAQIASSTRRQTGGDR